MAYLIYSNLARLNTSVEEEVLSDLAACCSSSVWAAKMLASRPFPMLDDLFAAAERCWFELPSVEQLAAYSAEQYVTDSFVNLDEAARTKFDDIKLRYQEKFGFPFVASTRGKDADELLAIASARLRNSAETELNLAAEEMNKIIQARLTGLLER